MEIKQLYRAILCLSEDDRYLIVQLYFEERTERCLAKELGCSQNAVNKRRQNILKRLRHLIENFKKNCFRGLSNRSANVEVIERVNFPHPLLKNTVHDGHIRKHRYFSCSSPKGKASRRIREDHLQVVRVLVKRKESKVQSGNYPSQSSLGRLPAMTEQPIMILPPSHSPARSGITQ